MKRDMENLNLRDTFKATPDKCRDALMTAARSVREEEPVRRITVRAVLITACIILATMAIAIAATKTLGWGDFFEIFYGDTDAVTKEAQEIMDNTKQQTFTVGPVAFTVQSLFADEQEAMASTLVTTADGSKAIIVMDYFYEDTLSNNDEFGEMLAKLYGVDPETTWIDVAKKLNCPLYSVGARLHMQDPYDAGGGMYDVMYDEEGRLVYFSTSGIVYPDNESVAAQEVLELPAQLSLWVEEVDLETGDTKDIGDALVDVMIPMSLQSEPVEYQVPEDYVVFGLHLDSVKAAKTAAGVYLYLDFTDQGHMQYRRDYIRPAWTDEDGNEYPDGINMSHSIDTDQSPQVYITSMISADSIPERIRFQLADEEKGDDGVPPVTLELKK